MARLGRGKAEKLYGVLQSKHEIAMRDVTYQVFDLPAMDQPFEVRCDTLDYPYQLKVGPVASTRAIIAFSCESFAIQRSW